MKPIALSGRPAGQITVEALLRGELGSDDVRIHPEMLAHQARVAQEHGNPQLASNFRRAAELTAVSDEELLAIYEALRPRRSTASQLAAIAGDLVERGAPTTAALVREAAEVYGRRGLLA